MKNNEDDSGGRTFKLQLMVAPAELDAIDDWRFRNRMPTRAAAIRELLRRSLEDVLAQDALKRSGNRGDPEKYGPNGASG